MGHLADTSFTGIARLQQILDITSAINKVSMVTTSQFDVPEKPLEAFTDPFDELLTIASSEEFEQQRLDEVVVSAIAPTVSRVCRLCNLTIDVCCDR